MGQTIATAQEQASAHAPAWDVAWVHALARQLVAV